VENFKDDMVLQDNIFRFGCWGHVLLGQCFPLRP